MSRYYKLNKPIENVNDSQLKALKIFNRKIDSGEYKLELIDCLCGSSDSITVAEKDRYGLDVKTLLCKNCGLMRTSPRLSKDSLNKFYEEDYRPIYVGHEKTPDLFFEEQIEHGKKIYKFISENIEINKEKKIVYDIGCGAGGILLEFAKNNCETYGCDLGSKYLERGRKEGLILEHGNHLSLKKYPKADIIIISHVLEHFYNPIEVLEETFYMLKDNGIIYIEVPGILNIFNAYGDFLLFLQNAHLFHFNVNTLTNIMKIAKFELIYANENINALYRKNINIDKVRYDADEYKKIYNYLILIEFYRTIRLKKILSIYFLFRSIFVSFLRKTLGTNFTNKLKTLYYKKLK